jgi:sigma-B regulation protein RsbU (phosphoserine phosphatase)
MESTPVVLVIDDQPVNLKLLETIFRKEGFQVLLAENGPEGRLLARSEIPDLILLDIMMPGEDGFETCRQLKMHPLTADIPVLFLTAVNDLESKIRGLTIGAVDYITKPFEKTEVLARARVHIRLKRATEALVREQQDRLRQLGQAQQDILVLPEDLPQARFMVYYHPAQEAGGDFYDVLELGPEIFGYFVADISGHDLGASFITPALKVLLRENSGPLFSPRETLRRINSVLLPLLKEEQHLTACFAHLNRSKKRLTLVSAGHLPAVFLSRAGDVRLIHSPGDVIGMFETPALESCELAVEAGDRFFLFTDGLVEFEAAEGELRLNQLEELQGYCRSLRNMPLEEGLPAMITRFYAKYGSPGDDLLLLGVEV